MSFHQLFLTEGEKKSRYPQMWIPAGTKQHGQIKWFFPGINASPLSSAREVSVRCVQFRSA
ncbi:hypothetical protein BK333_25105 [Escherichia coli]|nr:hypothetical protein BK333_25105 [Escherichia coli]